MKTIQVTENEIEFVFVTNYYNIELTGLCRYQGKLYSFDIDDGFDLSSDESIRYTLTSLSPIQKVKRLFDKKLFELCVGTHWSFDKVGQREKYRRPKWLYRLLHNLYYRKYYKQHPTEKQFNRH